jgi:hypothetical protein
MEHNKLFKKHKRLFITIALLLFVASSCSVLFLLTSTNASADSPASTTLPDISQSSSSILPSQNPLDVSLTPVVTVTSNATTIATPVPTVTLTPPTSVLEAQATSAVNTFDNEAMSWGMAHEYHDPTDGQTYLIDNAYINFSNRQPGLDNAYNTQASGLAIELQNGNYQGAIDDAATDMVELKALEADYVDTTPNNQMHQSDLTVVNYYEQLYPKLASQQIIVVSLAKQVLRVYEPGMKLEKEFSIISGEDTHPSPPGVWNIGYRLSPTYFKSPYPKGSPYWYPKTYIPYAMQYKTGGYFLHSAWWRSVFGEYDQFPHADPGGTQYAGDGSHGCINIQDIKTNPTNPPTPTNAEWLYTNTSYNTVVIIY